MSKLYEWNGKHYRLTELSEACGVDPATILARIKRGWTMNRVTHPIRHMEVFTTATRQSFFADCLIAQAAALKAAQGDK